MKGVEGLEAHGGDRCARVSIDLDIGEQRLRIPPQI